MSQLDDVLAHIDADQPQALERLFDLLRMESISTDPAYAAECEKAADWLVEDLKSLGFEATRHDTPGRPMVVAHSGGSGKHLLFYGHYDVQPVDPLELWTRPPFEPMIEDTPHGQVIRARGASDDKGQLMTFLEACRAWKAVTGALPANITILFEGEEESGSPSLIPFLEAHAEELKAELALVCDTGMLDRDTPAIATRLRGMLGEQITVKAASKDLHSGAFGGPAANPIRVLAKILAGLHDTEGRVTLPGFYDGVADLPAEIKAQWDALNFDGEAFLGEVGLKVPAGEQGYSALEQIWSRPTLEFNGIIGGYTGEGFKTVLPAQASAKVSMRLVSQQDPMTLRAALRAYVESCLPADVTVEYKPHGGSMATELPTDTPEFTAAQAALTEEWATEAVFSGMGGSIPIVGHFRKILGMNSLMVGFGLDDDQIHSPNEKYELRSFHKGTRSWARILEALAKA
ncbi:dipeptidase [Paroceanicella profunda]|uniref:Dipeptidase n=1 Tax=Paroceanicella profunda TaxID=2579971 RepID=A0A5B8FZN3_9RHOB|nr:dipeptidase [Paroceanicella profunda]QDL92249.1 dipeptidase [Paroceanicella profunda]